MRVIQITTYKLTIAHIPSSIFRAYDIRGIVGKTLTKESVFIIGLAIGSLVGDLRKEPVVIGRDGRVSGPSLSKALAKGLRASGCDVIDIGVVPTPLLYYAIPSYGTHSGIMLTGSHNTSEYNGLKIIVHGKTLAGDLLKALYERIKAEQFHEGRGGYYQQNVINYYSYEVAKTVKLKRPLRIVVDAGNGVAGMVAVPLYQKLGCEVYPLYCEVDGHFPNHHPDPSQPENMTHLIKAVAEKQADIGIAFDGDGDRLGVVTNSGTVIDSDRILMLFAQSVLAQHPGANVIYDVKCTHHLTKWIQDHQGLPVMSKTGHALIKAKIAETNALLAGELSGHFFFKDRWYGFDDGIYAGARVLEILSQQADISSDTLFNSIPKSINTPELKIQVSEDEKFQLMKTLIDKAFFPDAQEVILIDGLRANFHYGWGLIRPSNTSPYLILRFEADTQEQLRKIQGAFRKWLLSVKPSLLLPF